MNVSYTTETQSERIYIYKTIMKVQSTDYPDIKEIECSAWGDQTDSYVSFKDLKNTMMGVFELEK